MATPNYGYEKRQKELAKKKKKEEKLREKNDRKLHGIPEDAANAADMPEESVGSEAEATVPAANNS